MSAKLIITDGHGVRELRLNRPEVRNALDEELIAALTAAVQEAGREPGVRFVLIRGEGETFCAGADIAYMQRVAGRGHEENLADARALSALFQAVSDCPRPVICRVHGAAVGGAVGLVAASDVVVAEEGARFGFTEARLGVVPAVIAPFALRRLGPGACRSLFLTTTLFGVEEALRLGLVDRVAAVGGLEETTAEVVADLRRGGPEAQAACKRLLDEIGPLPLEEAVRRTPEHIARARAGREAREGLAAFLEKRPARWTDGEAS